MGSGVSGGEEGARYGPSLMPGGHTLAWPHIKDIFQTICAQCEKDACCDWVGEEGAGHYVKMVHNGIEYGDMQVNIIRVPNKELLDKCERGNNIAREACMLKGAILLSPLKHFSSNCFII